MSIDNDKLPMLGYFDVDSYTKNSIYRRNNDPIKINVALPTKNPVSRFIFFANQFTYRHDIKEPILIVCPYYENWWNDKNTKYCYIPLLAYCTGQIPKNVFKWKNSARFLPTMQIRYLLDEDHNPLWVEPPKPVIREPHFLNLVHR